MCTLDGHCLMCFVLAMCVSPGSRMGPRSKRARTPPTGGRPRTPLLHDVEDDELDDDDDEDGLFIFHEATVKITTRYMHMPYEDPLLCSILEREDEVAYCKLSNRVGGGKALLSYPLVGGPSDHCLPWLSWQVYSITVRDKRPWNLELSPLFEQLRIRRLAVSKEASRMSFYMS